MSPKDLSKLAQDKNFDAHKVYGCIVKPDDYLEHRNGKAFSMGHYVETPSEYSSLFHERIAPYASMIINGIYWDTPYPRLLTKEHVRSLTTSGCFRLVSIADISCDINGSLEFMDRASTIDRPFFYYDAKAESYHYDPVGPGIQIMSIDNLPTQLPREASEHFGKSLFPFARHLVSRTPNATIERAKIADRGVLAKGHGHLTKTIQQVLASQ